NQKHNEVLDVEATSLFDLKRNAHAPACVNPA
ncbi:MAG: hypothetical protein RL375_1428, partial [Pseudomonadota bacterium]